MPTSMPSLTQDVARVTSTYLDPTRGRDLDAADFAPTLAAVERAQARIGAAHADPALSPAGRQFEAERAVAEALAAIEADAATNARLAERIEAAEAAALTAPSGDQARLREIRLRLSGKTDAEQRMIYLQSIDTGDVDTQAAFEDAPPSISILDADTRARARARQLAAAPPEVQKDIEQLQQRLAARQHVADVARRRLRAVR